MRNNMEWKPSSPPILQGEKNFFIFDIFWINIVLSWKTHIKMFWDNWFIFNKTFQSPLSLMFLFLLFCFHGSKHSSTARKFTNEMNFSCGVQSWLHLAVRMSPLFCGHAQGCGHISQSILVHLTDIGIDILEETLFGIHRVRWGAGESGPYVHR